MKERKNDGESLDSLKHKTCLMIEENNRICHEISAINRSLEKKPDIHLQNKRDDLTKKADEYFEKIHQHYDTIVRLEKEINNRDVDPGSPSFLQILHENDPRLSKLSFK